MDHSKALTLRDEDADALAFRLWGADSLGWALRRLTRRHDCGEDVSFFPAQLAYDAPCPWCGKPLPIAWAK